MSSQRIKIQKASDKTIFNLFNEVGGLFGGAKCNVDAIGFNQFVCVFSEEENPAGLDLLLKKNSTIINTMVMGLPGLNIYFHRGGNCQDEQKSAVYDEVSLTTNNQSPPLSAESRVELIALINKKLKVFEPKKTLGGSLTPEQAQLEAIHSATLDRLENLNEALVEETHNYRKKLGDEISAKELSLEERFRSLESELKGEAQKKVEELQQQRDLLEERRKELDDKNNTHARREIRRDILSEIKKRQEKFTLTEGTKKLRPSIAAAMLLLVGLFACGALSAAMEFHRLMGENIGNKLYFVGVKQLLYSAGAVGSVVFFIRWLNRWFEQHSQAEFQLKQFELDMERASWIVETSLEWKDAKGTTIPTALLESLSRNLFSEKAQDVAPLVHPTDQLASALVGSASKVKLQLGDSLLEVDPRKLAKSKKVQAPPSPSMQAEG